MEVITYKKECINIDLWFFLQPVLLSEPWSYWKLINTFSPINKALPLVLPRKRVLYVELAQVSESHNREALYCGSWVNMPWMAQSCCAHVQECWVGSKPTALAHSSSESAWQHRALMQTVSQTMLIVDTVSMVQACIAAFTHNIYPASCKSHLSLLPNTWVLWVGVEAVWKWVRI